MESSRSRLTPLQQDLLRAFFDRERGFFLTGGAALAGFYLGHRETSDLDLFTLEGESFERGRHVLRAVAGGLGATLEARQIAPGFERYAALRGTETVIVDLVLERVQQAYPQKTDTNGIRLDPIEEILINKLTTALSRAEERDLVDLMFLERAGLSLESALPAALAKDGGCTPAALAYVLSQIRIPDGVPLPSGVAPAELRSYLEDLVKRLRDAAAPPGGKAKSPPA